MRPARTIHEGSSPLTRCGKMTRCAKRQCGAHWKARSRTNSTASTWKEHALCFHDYRQPQQKIHE